MRSSAILVMTLLCASLANAKDDTWPAGVDSASAMHSCQSSRGENLVVWTNKNKEVVAVSTGSNKHQLPKYLAPMVLGASTSSIQKTNVGYKIQSQGPGYDREDVLVAEGMRFSCVGNSDD